MCELLQIEAVVMKGNENVLRSEERGAGSESTVKAPDSGAETNLAPSYLRTSAPSKSNLAPQKEYYQTHAHRTGFLPDLSILDLLFNMGNESILYLL